MHAFTPRLVKKPSHITRLSHLLICSTFRVRKNPQDKNYQFDYVVRFNDSRLRLAVIKKPAPRRRKKLPAVIQWTNKAARLSPKKKKQTPKRAKATCKYTLFTFSRIKTRVRDNKDNWPGEKVKNPHCRHWRRRTERKKKRSTKLSSRRLSGRRQLTRAIRVVYTSWVGRYTMRKKSS